MRQDTCDSEKAKYSQQVKDIVAKYTAKINDTGEEINLAGLEELLRQAKAEIEGLNLTARDKSKMKSIIMQKLYQLH